MRPAFEKGLSDAGVVRADDLPYDQLRDAYQAVDGLQTGFGRTDLAGKSPAEIKSLFDQLSVLKEHGFGYTDADLRSLSPDVVAREYADTVRAGAANVDDLPPAAPKYKPGTTAGALGGDLPAALKDFWTSTFQPELVSDRAVEADPLFARYKSAQAQEKDAIIRQFDAGWRYWNRKSDSERFRFLDQMERGIRTGNGYEDAMMRTWRRLLDENWAEEQRWGSTASFVDDYVPHVWEPPDRWRAFSERKAQQLGPTWFQKGRSFDFISEGLAAGLKLRHTNPADLIVHRLLSGVDMRQRMQLLYMLKPMGLAWEGVQGGQQLMRRGWQPINAPDRKQWMVHPDVQLLWKNAVEAQGLWAAENYAGNAFRGWMALKNAWVPVKLGLSAFHPLHVLHINQAEMLTMAARSARQGDFADALHELGEGLATIPTLGLPSYRKGRIIKQAWEKRPADQTPEERAIVGLLHEMGITAQLSEQLRIDGERKLAESWARITRGEGSLGDLVLLTPRMIARAIKFVSGPVFEHWIPAPQGQRSHHGGAGRIEAGPVFAHRSGPASPGAPGDRQEHREQVRRDVVRVAVLGPICEGRRHCVVPVAWLEPGLRPRVRRGGDGGGHAAGRRCRQGDRHSGAHPKPAAPDHPRQHQQDGLCLHLSADRGAHQWPDVVSAQRQGA
jgi:hypothetical protein